MINFLSKKYLINTLIFLVICLIVFLYNKKLTLNKFAPIVITSTGTYQKGNTFLGIQDREGINKYEAIQAKNALDLKFKVRSIVPGTRYEVFKSTFGTLFDFNLWTKNTGYFNVHKSTENKFYCTQISIPYVEIITTASGTVENTLYEAMAENGISPEKIMTFSDIFSWQVDFFNDVRKGDLFKLIYKRYKHDNNVLRDGEILAAQYAGKVSGKHIAIYFKSEDGKLSFYYTPEGSSLRKLFLKAPLNYRRISSYFSLKRFHPILRTYRPHLGIDYAAPSGTPVSSIGDGTVIFAGWYNGYGKFIKIRHNSAYTSCYGHLSKFSKGLSVGKRVRQGNVIGYVGKTGLATGPHLDFAIIKNGSRVNFLRLKFPPASNVPEKYKAEFETVKNNILPLLEPPADTEVKK